jgi:hypothetical protein
VAVLPVAVVPLWHVVQVPAPTDAWLYAAGVQPVVRWPVSHDCVVTTCAEVFPFAVVPLWQLVHVPGAIPMWSKRAIENDAVTWHSAHPCVVGGCDGGIVVALTRAPAAWQPSQLLGVPLKMPRVWQASQGVFWCAPLSAKPVAK